MAIDFFVMPLSRYVAGDFVTPAMRFAWEQGLSYAIVGPQGTRRLPPDVPFGGPEASARRRAILPMINEDLRALPNSIHPLWDEQVDAEPRFHRVDPASYQALLEEAERRRQRPSFLGFFRARRSSALHLTAGVFLPSAFDDSFQMASPIAHTAGSVQTAIRELSTQTWSDAAIAARDTLLAALEDARELRQPMIVDA